MSKSIELKNMIYSKIGELQSNNLIKTNITDKKLLLNIQQEVFKDFTDIGLTFNILDNHTLIYIYKLN